MTDHSDVIRLTTALRQAAAVCDHRCGALLAGSRAWGQAAAGAAIEPVAPDQVLWIGDAAPAGYRTLAPAQARQVLGSEVDALVFDAWAGFDLEALGASAGAVRAGGMLLLIAPPLADWPRWPDPERRRITVHPHPPEAVGGRYLARLARIAACDPGVVVVAEGTALPEPPAVPANPPAAAAESPPFRTADQRLAVAAIERVATGHRRRPAVLTADRGRGKSAALGIAAGRLLHQPRQILVTAPRLEAVEPVFRHAAEQLPEPERGHALLRSGAGSLTFVPPDELLRHPREADLLLVDEAAAIPTPILERLLARYARIAFSTTIHGYEGTGRGFALRFGRVLERITPGWRPVQLETPVRWAADDPLERLLFRALLLDAAPAPEEALAGLDRAAVDAGSGDDECRLEPLDRDRLAGDEPLLRQLFGLLVSAHYRTSPLDLRHLLDGPNITVWVARYRGQVAATALIAREGGFDAAMAHAVWMGERRPRGHLLPETLAAHLGLEAAPCLTAARVMRIAVHPAVQRRGLGHRLLAAIAASAQEVGVDYLGTSFGVTPELLDFWEGAGYRPVRLGARPGAASTARSVLLLRPLSARGERLAAAARGRFLGELPHQFADPLRDVEPHLAARLLGAGGASGPDAADHGDLVAFARGRRPFEDSPGAIWRLALAGLTAPGQVRLTPAERDALVLKVIQKRSWGECAEQLGLTGRAQVDALLRAAVARLLSAAPADGRPSGAA